MIISCRELKFDNHLSQERINRAVQIFGNLVIKRILCFALYLLGATRPSIAKQVRIPTESVKTFIKNIQLNGISAFEDRRCSSSSFLPHSQKISPLKINVILDENRLCVEFGSNQNKLKIPRNNKIQLRTILLTMLNSGLLSKKQTAKIVDLSVVQTQAIAKKLEEKDIYSLLDQRQGQKQDYIFSPEIKAELIQQFTANVATNRNTSSIKLAKDLKKRCNFDLSARSIRFHFKKLGLSRVKETLPKLIESLKKTPKIDI